MDQTIAQAQKIAHDIVQNIEKVIIGKTSSVEMAVIGLMSQGHLLIEDAPGVGKTMLARSLAKSVNCSFKRIQFTPDMLPGDITGVSVFNQKTSDFEFRPGPILANMVLADEINRATPRVQSALLECMEERQVSIDGVTHFMPSPFHVFATQNPIEYEGTFPLPETQLDRFLMRITLGYPSVEEEISIMQNQQFQHPIEKIKPVANCEGLIKLQESVKKIYVDPQVQEYIAKIVASTRSHPSIYLGVSPRGSLSLFRSVQARALMNGREFAIPEDVKALAESVLSHRLVLHSLDGSKDRSGRSIIHDVLAKIPVPGVTP
ncbi:MAG TPA: MoxR family ATPase [Dehalococcoidales bacterium]|nr:MoxR family ATPase [Dehalococcoidales bacterium]